MNYEFIDNVRISLESMNIFQYSIKGAKICALLLLSFSIIEKWGKNMLGNGNVLNDLFSILGLCALIISSDFLFNTVEGVFLNLNNSIGGVEDTMYSDLLGVLNEDYALMMDGANDWMDMLGVILSNIMFFVGYLLVLLLSGIVLLADMSMVCGYLLTRVFLLEIMKFLFPIAIALSTLKQTSGLIGKWLRMYIGLSLLGVIYIGIIGFSSLVAVELQNEFMSFEKADFWGSYLNLHYSIWAGMITIIIAFTIKATLFNKASSFINSFFN
jgi:hypothetical protein